MVTTPDHARPGVQLLAGDMQMWSDFDPGRQADDLRALPAPSVVWEVLLGPALRQVTGRVLLVGAQAAACIGLLPERAHVDVVVRSRTDAGVVVAARPGTRVYAGSILHFDARGRYDLVLALNTADDLLTPDDDPAGSAEVLAALDLLRTDGGCLVARVLNQAGLDGLVAERVRSGLAWGQLDPGMAHRALRAALPDAALFGVVGRRPRVVLDAVHAEEQGHAGMLTACVTNALVAGAPVDSVLRDPMRVVPAITEAGELGRLAPTWLAVVGDLALPGLVADLSLASALPGLELPDEPEHLDVDDDDDEEDEDDEPVVEERPQPVGTERAWRRLLVDDGDGPRVLALGGETVLGPLTRHADTTPVPNASSRVLEGRWRDAAASGEPERLRDELRAWARWLASIDPAEAWFASPHNVVVTDDGSFSLLDATWRWTGEADVDAAMTLCLRRFALRLLDTGASHLWPANVSLDAVTESLSLMADGTWSRATLTRAVRVGERIRALLDDGDETRVEECVERCLLAGSQHRLSVGGRLSREAQQRLLNQLGNEAAAQQLKVDWYERHVRRRDGQLDGLERQLESIEASIPYKVARAVTWPGRAAIRGAKGLVKRALPPSAWRRLIAAARKRLR